MTSAVDTRSDGWEGAATVREARPEEFDQAIVEWQHLMSFGFDPPQPDQLVQLVGVRLGQVVAFRRKVNCRPAAANASTLGGSMVLP